MELSPLILIIWGELTFFLAGGLFLILMNGFLKSRQGKKSVKGLLEKVKADRSRRLEEIKSGLAAYGIEGDDLEQKVAQIDKQELRLYQRISTMYRLRRDTMLSNMNIAVEATTKPYFKLGLNLDGASAKESSQDSEVDNSELEKLIEQNASLQAELSVTMDTIGRMLSEYSSMFGAEDEGDLDKGKIMEAFEVDESSDENLVETDLETLDEVVETDELLEIEEDIETDELLEIEDVSDSDDLSDIDDLFNGEVDVDEPVADETTTEAVTDDSDDLSDIDDLFNGEVDVDKPVTEEVIPDADDLFDEVADDIEVDELDEVVDIETDLDLPDEEEFVEIEGVDEFDIDALIDGGIDSGNEKV